MPNKGYEHRKGEHFAYRMTEDQVDAIDHAKDAVFSAARSAGKAFVGFYTLGTRDERPSLPGTAA